MLTVKGQHGWIGGTGGYRSVFPIADHQLLGPLDDTAQEMFLDTALRPRSVLATIELRQLGGEFANAPSHGGALDHLRGDTSLFATGLATTASRSAKIRHELDLLRAAMEPWATGYTSANYAEDRQRPQRSLPTHVNKQVEAIRARIDPSGLFAGDVSAVVPRLST